MPTLPKVPPPAADIAEIFATAGIFYTLFGWWAVACHGMNISTTEIDLVLDDDKIDGATNALVATGHFHRCTQLDCRERVVDRWYGSPLAELGSLPVGAFGIKFVMNNIHAIARQHLHIEPAKYAYFRVISLYTKSQLLWSFPNLDTTTTAPSSLFFLLCRDLGDHMGVDGAWRGMIIAALGPRFIDNDLHLTEEMKALRIAISPRWLPALDGFLFPDTVSRTPQYTALNRMRSTLLQNNELPDIPPHDVRGHAM
ncbi:hypothetical protein BJY00DRAFT_311082 [Aspergillus carlsbadensis]|nr:hypothetical protein BJY00DRAFT_311082 [Aspergillus carlsbadensis]